MSLINDRSYQHLIPAIDWFYVEDAPPGEEQGAVWRIAAWASDKNGSTVGLIAPDTRSHRSQYEHVSLSKVPSNSGVYLHISQLTAAELAQSSLR
jgi:hypothetical protein